MKRRLIQSALLGITGMLSMSACNAAEPTACDRRCLADWTDQVIASIVARDSTRLKLSNTYSATENSVPAALGMMTVYQTATAARGTFKVIDAQTQQVAFLSTLTESAGEALLFGRIKVQSGLLSEVELYTLRSRAEGGFQYSSGGLANMPAEWTQAVPAARRPTRAQLLDAGRSIFDTRVAAPDIAATCVIMENGKVVAENAEVAQSVAPAEQALGAPIKPNADGTVPIRCGNPPERPTDARARTDIIDEEQGIVVSIAMVHGVVQPYLVTTPTESAYVPNSMSKPYTEMLSAQQRSGKYQRPAIRPTAASQVVMEWHRVYDGKLQGLMMLQNVGPPGATSPWVQ